MGVIKINEDVHNRLKKVAHTKLMEDESKIRISMTEVIDDILKRLGL
ncbi:MAG: hypothetical protein ACYDAO_04425 [Thermoplasmataceae archaeon]